jgi:hypothetical protein
MFKICLSAGVQNFHRIERLFKGISSPGKFLFKSTPFFLLVKNTLKKCLSAGFQISHRVERLFKGRSSPGKFILIHSFLSACEEYV